jgi:hypothetical protein
MEETIRELRSSGDAAAREAAREQAARAALLAQQDALKRLAEECA